MLIIINSKHITNVKKWHTYELYTQIQLYIYIYTHIDTDILWKMF